MNLIEICEKGLPFKILHCLLAFSSADTNISAYLYLSRA